MLIQNTKSGAKDVVSKEEWAEMKKKFLPGDPSRSFASLFNVLDENQMSRETVPPGNIPVALKVSKKTENTEQPLTEAKPSGAVSSDAKKKTERSS